MTLSKKASEIMETERIQRYMKVYVEAGNLLEPSGEPVDVWMLAQETGLPEKQVEQAMRDLHRQKLVEVNDAGDIVATNPLPRGECRNRV